MRAPQIPTVLALLLVPLFGAAILSAKMDPALKPVTPFDDPAYHSLPEQAGLPRVLLIGDSISIGYTLPARERLKGFANVHRPAQNCGPTQMGLAQVDGWLGSTHWDVIHFNFGLHDLKYIDANGDTSTPDKGRQLSPLPVYEKNLRALVARLKRTGAKLIFATTTPVPAGVGFRVEGDERHYNDVALRVMKENGVAIDDLWSFVRPQQAKLQNPHDVHFSPAGSTALGGAVAESIKSALR